MERNPEWMEIDSERARMMCGRPQSLCVSVGFGVNEREKNRVVQALAHLDNSPCL